MMMKFLVGLGVLVIVGLGALAVLSWQGERRWAAATQALRVQLDATQQPAAVTRYDPARELPGLPAPVQRYFRAALTEGQPLVAAVELAHHGRFNVGESTDQWKPFVSTQRAATQRPGFVWDGAVMMLPGLPVRVHDAYVAGEGRLHPAVLGWWSLAKLRDRDEVARGELMRYLAEAAWYPTALLPSQGVRWEAVDDRAARATLQDGALAVTLTFRFGADDLIASVRAEERGRTVGGRSVPTPWEGRWSQPERRDGMVVPRVGEVAWLLPEGARPYWRGQLARLDYVWRR